MTTDQKWLLAGGVLVVYALIGVAVSRWMLGWVRAEGEEGDYYREILRDQSRGTLLTPEQMAVGMAILGGIMWPVALWKGRPR